MTDFHLALLEFQFPALPTLAAASNAALLAQQPVSSPEQCHAMTCTGALSKGYQTTSPVYAQQESFPPQELEPLCFPLYSFVPPHDIKLKLLSIFLKYIEVTFRLPTKTD